MFQSLHANIVQLLRCQASRLIQAQIFLRHVGVKDQHVVGIDGDVHAVAVKLRDRVVRNIGNTPHQHVARRGDVQPYPCELRKEIIINGMK